MDEHVQFLYATNQQAAANNLLYQASLHGKLYEYTRPDGTKCRFKKNQQAMLSCNLDAENGLYNGQMIVCRAFSKEYVVVEIMQGSNKGKRERVPAEAIQL